MRYAHITGWGKYVPAKIMTNDDMSKLMDTSDEWIRTRTGIRQRHFAAENETCTKMAIAAATEAIDNAGILPSQIDLVIVATSTTDQNFPSTASLVQDAVGASNAGAYDLVAACAGFIYALTTGADAIKAGSKNCVLVIGAEKLSRFLDFKDRGTAVLFGDGAGAVVLQASDQPGGVMSSVLHSDGSGGNLLYLDQSQKVQMNGAEVYKFATRIMGGAAKEVISKAGWRIGQVDMFVPHQANIRIIDSAAKMLGLPMEKFFVNIHNYGNTSAASIPIALCEAAEQGKLRQNDKIVMVGFGGGLAWGAVAVEWDVPLPKRGVRRLLNRAGTTAERARAKVRRSIWGFGARRKKDEDEK
jgi:3-oxoacyl-[acyl-carrier-protein] synthase-3